MNEIILDTVDDLVAAFLYYDRKEDEELPMGSIEQTIADKDITIDEIVKRFKEKLIEGISE